MPELRAPEDMTLPQLVNEYAERKAYGARGGHITATGHARHCAVVEELRKRGALDR